MVDFTQRLARFSSRKFHRLRDGQRLVLEEYSSNHRQTQDLAIEMGTGEGKTLIALLIADYALDTRRSVAYLTGTRQLAQYVREEAIALGLDSVLFSAGNYGGQSLSDYHDAQTVGIMNYWVYFNSNPRPQPADLLILDDAHLAEQPLVGMYKLRIPRTLDDSAELYTSLCDLVLANTNRYRSLQAMRDGTAELGTPPELLAFSDWDAVAAQAQRTINSSMWTNTSNARFPWRQIRDRLPRCAVLVGPSAIEIGPYHPPTQLNPWYKSARQRIYLSATLGTMDDLQRRIGGMPISRLMTPAQFSGTSTGARRLVLNPTELPFFDPSILEWALAQVPLAGGKAAWLCSSNAEANLIEQILRDSAQSVFRLQAGDDDMINVWRHAPLGHLVTAGRYDGLDLAGDICRLVIIPTVPRASTEFERFVVAYLGDAGFMRHRIGQRITQAIGRANRAPDDRALYLGLDPSFAQVLADPSVRRLVTAEAESTVQEALALHEFGLEQAVQACTAFWQGKPDSATTRKHLRKRRPGRTVTISSNSQSADNEVRASTELWLGSAKAASAARTASETLTKAGESEHGAFWRYVEAHSHYLKSDVPGVRSARKALNEAIDDGPRTVWFRRLEGIAASLAGRVSVANHLDDLFLSWDEWIRESGRRTYLQLEATRNNLEGTHNERCEGLKNMARLLGVTGDRPHRTEQSAPDCIWKWISPRGGERRVWEVKTGGPPKVPRADINQLLGQIEVERMRSTNARILGCLMTQALEIEDDAARAARDKIAIIHESAVLKLFDIIYKQFTAYVDSWDGSDAQARGRARLKVEAFLPHHASWTSLLVPSSGNVLLADDVEALFPPA
ncbi:MAG: hypothetical protein F4X18_02470 [Acidimicrobiia bacterium]|nr:hypothetical protein [Acidimicrobiia bacterium]